MPTETAADLESFFEEEEFAEAAVYTGPGPGDVATSCTVIVDRGQGRERFKSGDAEYSGSERHLYVRAAEIATVKSGGIFAVGTIVDDVFVPGGESFQATSVPKLDQTGKLWSVQLLIRD